MLAENRGFWKAFLLSIITLGFYNWYLIHSFAQETNVACKGDGRHTRGLLAYLIFGFLTLGIYQIVWTYNWIDRCNVYLLRSGKPQGLSPITYLLTVFILGPITLGIMYLVVYCKQLYLQNAVNRTYNAGGGSCGCAA